MYVKLIALLALASLVVSNDVVVGSSSNGKEIFNRTISASPAIWKQVDNVTINAGETDIITRIVITDLRPKKNGEAKIVEGGEGHKNVTVELKSPTIFRGYEFNIEVYAVLESEYQHDISEQLPANEANGFSTKDVPVSIGKDTKTNTDDGSSNLPTVTDTTQTEANTITTPGNDNNESTKITAPGNDNNASTKITTPGNDNNESTKITSPGNDNNGSTINPNDQTEKSENKLNVITTTTLLPQLNDSEPKLITISAHDQEIQGSQTIPESYPTIATYKNDVVKSIKSLHKRDIESEDEIEPKATYENGEDYENLYAPFEEEDIKQPGNKLMAPIPYLYHGF